MGLKPELWQALRFSSEAARITESQKLLDQMAQSLPVSERLIFLLNKWAAEEEYLGVELDRLVALKKELSEGSPLRRLWRRLGYWKRIDRFMQRFYRRLESLPRDEALRQTQIEFLRRDEDLLEWAGWQLYGAPDRLLL